MSLTNQTEFKMILGTYCSNFRKDHFGINQKQMARKYGIPNSSFCNFETGTCNKFEYIYAYIKECKTPELKKQFLDGLQDQLLSHSNTHKFSV